MNDVETPLVDAGIAGGNIIVDSVAGDAVRLHQDLRDTEGWWFYWAFRVCGAEGRTLRFEFTNGDVLGALGPAVSEDGGATWRWLGLEGETPLLVSTPRTSRTEASGREARLEVSERSSLSSGSAERRPPQTPLPGFEYRFGPKAQEVRFSFNIPYFEGQWAQFLGRCGGSPSLQAGVLCRSEKGRDVELLRVGRLDGQAEHRLLLPCRHHACESMADYVLEGIIEAALAEDGDGRWFRDHAEILAIPFVDKDGVEEGNQGKNRRPHDHNRDYAEPGIYPTVRVLKDYVARWSGGRLKVALDLHCPWIKGWEHEDIFFVGGPDPSNWARMEDFSRFLQSAQTGPLVFNPTNNLPFGQRWNVEAETYFTFSRWAEQLPGMQLAATIEIPYARVAGVPVVPDGCRAFGRDLARALRRFLSV